LAKIRKGEADDQETKKFKQLYFQKTCDILEKSYEELFIIKKISDKPPLKAKVEQSEICDKCGEATMSSKLLDVGGRKICRACV
jgi:formylmethanofuran dehydrogenase subunit E